MDNTSGVPNDPLSRFALSIFDLNGLLMRNGDRMTRSIGQSSARWQVLGRAGYMPQTVAQMAREMGHARQSVQRVANELVKEGLAVYTEKPDDKRTQLLELTPRGEEVLAEIYALDQEWSRSIMSQLDPEQLVQVAAILEQIARVFEADEQRASQADDPGKT